jgi:hypothetical protein
VLIGVADQDDEIDTWISGKEERDVAEVLKSQAIRVK